MLLFIWTLAACGLFDAGKDDDDDDDDDVEDTAGDSGGGDTGGGDSAEDTSADDVVPEIVSVDLLTCTEQQSAGETWMMQLTVTDPQGPSTVRSGSVDVLDSGGRLLASYAISCGSGSCIGSFRASYDDVTCALSGSITMRFVVEDEDGNTSAPLDVAA